MTHPIPADQQLPLDPDSLPGEPFELALHWAHRAADLHDAGKIRHARSAAAIGQVFATLSVGIGELTADVESALAAPAERLLAQECCGGVCGGPDSAPVLVDNPVVLPAPRPHSPYDPAAPRPRGPYDDAAPRVYGTEDDVDRLLGGRS